MLDILKRWEKLSAGGDPKAQQCGWLKDKFGMSWQIVPVALPALRHRLILNFEAEAEGITTDHIIRQVLTEVPRLAEAVAA